MNKLIPGALFSTRAAREQRLREHIHNPNHHNQKSPGTDNAWLRAADGFNQNDPDGTKLNEMFQSIHTK